MSRWMERRGTSLVELPSVFDFFWLVRSTPEQHASLDRLSGQAGCSTWSNFASERGFASGPRPPPTNRAGAAGRGRGERTRPRRAACLFARRMTRPQLATPQNGSTEPRHQPPRRRVESTRPRRAACSFARRMTRPQPATPADGSTEPPHQPRRRPPRSVWHGPCPPTVGERFVM